MKYISLTLTVFFAALLAMGTAVSAIDFSDIENNQYKESIQNLANVNILKGYEDGTFRPDNAINRAELTKIVLESLDIDTSEQAENCFPDVRDQWFAQYVCKAKELGILQGYPDGTFKPEGEINIVESLSIIVETFEIPTDEKTEDANWYDPYVNFAHENNIFPKYSYSPGQSANRGEMAYLVDRIIDIEAQQTYTDAQRNSKSRGCGLNPPASPPTVFSVNDIERSTITVVPENYNNQKQYSLVFAFHGRTNSNEQVRRYYGIESASKGEAIIVYPSGIPLPSGGGYTWSDGGNNGSNLRDYALFDEIYSQLTDSYCIDLDKVYAVGHSLGAWFTNSLACARGDVLRAVGTLGGSRSDSECSGPVAVMQWHNPNDNLAAFSTGEVARDQYIKQNKCSNEFVSVSPSEGNCVEYKSCTDYNPTVWCPHTQDYNSSGTYYTHNWPKGTGKFMWDFFSSLD